MKIGIAGGAGFVGANLAVYLASLGHKITVLDNLVRRGSEYNLPRLKAVGVEFVHGDIRCKEDLAPLTKVEAILECSAQPSAVAGTANPTYDFTNNTIGLFNILEIVRATKAKLIFWSTNKVYSGHVVNNKDGKFDESTTIDGGNKSLYGMSKVMADLACQEYATAYGLDIIVNRFSCLAGPYQWGKSEQGWVAWFAIAAILGLPIKLIGWDGKQVRDILFMNDLCYLINRQLTMPHKHTVYNVGGGDIKLSPREAVGLLRKLLKKKIPTTYEPEVRYADQRVYVSDISRVCADFDWHPKTDEIQGYVQIVDWCKENLDTIRTLYDLPH